MIYSSWAKHTEIGNFRLFFTLYPTKNPKNQNFEKWKNLLEISSFYICAPEVIWRTVTEIWKETGKILKKMKKMPGDIILSYMHVYHKWRSYNIWYIWFLKHKVWQKFLTFWAIFCPFSPLTTPPTSLMILKIKILKEKKKCLEILSFYIYMCTISEDDMIYGSWNITCNRQIFVILGHFFLSAPCRGYFRNWRQHSSIRKVQKGTFSLQKS